jgi:outer membrane protein OmpA-like peptidoglycan-associated protein
MQKRLLLSTGMFFLAMTLMMGQYAEAPDGLGIRGVFPNYQWPMDQKIIGGEFGGGIEIEYVGHLNNYLNFAIPFRISEAQLPLDELGNTRNAGILGLDATLQLKLFNEPSFVYPYLLAGVGVSTEDFGAVNLIIPLGLGLNFRMDKHVYLSTKGEYRASFDDLRSNLQLGLGLHFILGEGKEEAPVVIDADGDGVPDAQDLCPTVAGIAGLNGCPDGDGDGITDGDDACPTIAGTLAFQGCPDTDGDGIADPDDECPEEAGDAANNGCPVEDADGDGVPDAEDLCPNAAGSVATGGCPDRDGDGIADKDDKCPDEAGTVSAGGCPDADGDGVVDSADKCPDSAGTSANNGCPEITKEDKETLDLAVQAVQFETGRATLKLTSNSILDQIVDMMNRYTDYKLAINGHTDSVGSSRTNQRLSEQRAKACNDYLISKGISAERIRFTGFGETQPIADNRYKAGREQNRRVEFDLYLE